MTEDQIAHIRARVAVASAIVVMEETLREHLGPAALFKRAPKGKLDKSDERYIKNVCDRAIKEAKKATSFVEKRLFAEGVYDVAYEELYTSYKIYEEALWLNPEQREKVLNFIKEVKDVRSS